MWRYLGSYILLKLLAIALNLLSLFIFGTGQAFCFCTEVDDCQGAANLLVVKRAVNSQQRDLQFELTSDINENCCVDCFKSMDAAGWVGKSVDSSDFEVIRSFPPWTVFVISQNEIAERNSIRAPPNGYGSPGTKTYLAKRVFLI